jgi:hypothetical protein
MAFVFDAVACALQTSVRSGGLAGEYMDSRSSPGSWELSQSPDGAELYLLITPAGFTESVAVEICLPSWLRITRT